MTLPDSESGLRSAVALLQAGDLVAFPTETVYGLGADAGNDRAIARVFAAKGRPAFNPLIIHLLDLAGAERMAELPAPALLLARAFWPGPLTLVLNRRADAPLSELATAGLPTVALRVPDHPIAQRLLAAFGRPLAAPSANPSGAVSPTRPDHVREGLDGRIAAIFEGGACPVGLESTILGFDGDIPVLLRPGALPVESIEAKLGLRVDVRALRHVAAPGQLESHYAPDAMLRLEAAGPGAGEVWLGFGPIEVLRPGLNLSPAGDLTEAAANLFAHLRAADALARETGATRIAVAPIPMHGLGLAINDRLRRAAAPRPGQLGI
ncbi:MAG: L-threonylcarbamoyladenylate synthase [Amaricoccus sp.]